MSRVEGRSNRLGAVFLTLAALLLVVCARSPITLLVSIWPVASWMLVGLAYLGLGTRLFQKREGRLLLRSKIPLLPHLVILYLVWHLARRFSRQPAYAALCHGIYIGRRMLRGEYPAARTIVDLTAEMDEHLPPGAVYIPFPILDATGCSAEGLRTIAQRIATAERPVYVHCAQGHGRTAMVAAVVLNVLEEATTPTEALTRIKNTRSGAVPNEAQCLSVSSAWRPPSNKPLQLPGFARS